MEYQKIEYKLVRENNLNYNRKNITSGKDVFNFFNDLQDTTKEKLFSMCLDGKNIITCFDLVSVGTNSKSLADPKELIKAAILTNATSLILVHNHPTGDPNPSNADSRTTKVTKEACRLFDIQLLDHVIIGNGKYFSFADSGLI